MGKTIIKDLSQKKQRLSDYPSIDSRILFVFFLGSGFCGLVYQVVWLRLAFAAFGIVTPVLSIVLSVFMLGLGLGSWLGGKYAVRAANKMGWSAIVLYAVMELLIGLGGLLVPVVFNAGQTVLLPAGDFNSLTYLVLSAIILAVTILPWCICMGTTIPLAMAFIKEINQENTRGFSLLYLANVIGAMAGTLISAMVLIELLGLSRTLLIAAFCNFSIAITAIIMNFSRSDKITKKTLTEPTTSVITSKPIRDFQLFLSILFITGFISMAMEVVWIRAFTPVMKTSIYAFAGILTVYLFSTLIGSWCYRKQASNKKSFGLFGIMTTISFSCFLPIFISDYHVWQLMPKDLQRALTLISIFPFCASLGYLTPKLIDQMSMGDPDVAGKAYAVNTFGCILGPIAAGYFLLPAVGVKYSLVLLALPFFGYFAYFFKSYSQSYYKKRAFSFVSILIVVVFLLKSTTYEDGVLYKNAEIRRDYVATVISFGERMDKHLLVNGIGMTELTPITKFMAHVPLSIRSRRPQSALIICFGMGTTLRSAVTWGVNATAVELVPSVRDAFGFYFKDADEIVRKPNVKIVVDDGRRYLRRISEQFDIITIDPPPPITSSGSSLLYSEQFYRVLKTRLKYEGILAQWFPSGEFKTLQAIAKSLSNEFPCVRVFKSVEGWGYHFFASMQEFKLPTASEFLTRLPVLAESDFIEWNRSKKPGELYKKFADGEISLDQILTTDVNFTVTDDRPFNEYFLIRRMVDKWTGHYLVVP